MTSAHNGGRRLLAVSAAFAAAALVLAGAAEDRVGPAAAGTRRPGAQRDRGQSDGRCRREEPAVVWWAADPPTLCQDRRFRKARS